ncbi:TatD-related deoxyribonuclease, partial [mine drainage metagenome]
DLSNDAMDELGRMGIKTGLKQHMVIKHHASPTNIGMNSQLTQSMLATRPNIRDALKISSKFLLETDYVDDPMKPGKVISPDSVPKRALMIRGEYHNHEKIFHEIFYDLPSRIYDPNLFEI